MKKKKETFTEISIYLPIYGRTVIVFPGGPNLKNIVAVGKERGIPEEKFTTSWKQEVGEAIEKSGGFCTTYGDDNADLIVWTKSKPTNSSTFGVLYHELYHAVDFIAAMIDPGNKMTDKTGNSEARAYLFEYLATECNKILWKVKTKKHGRK